MQERQQRPYEALKQPAVMVAVSTVDGATVNLLHLAGNSGPLVLFLHANGFHIKCYTPLVLLPLSYTLFGTWVVAHLKSLFPWLQAENFAKHNYQCWGVEFRGQGSLPAPPGNLVDLYLSDLFAVVDSLSLRGPLPDCPLHQAYGCLLLMSVPFAACQESAFLLGTLVLAVNLQVC